MFEEVLNIEVASTNELLNSNAEKLQEVANYQQLCSDSFVKGQKAISTWVSTDIDYRVSYTCESDSDDDGPSTNAYCNASCTYEEAENVFIARQNGEPTNQYQSCTCSDVASMVGDISALRQAAFATATEYSEYSQSTVCNPLCIISSTLISLLLTCSCFESENLVFIHSYYLSSLDLLSSFFGSLIS